jgi:hypothetical protein
LPTAVKRFGRASGIRALIRREHSARGGTVWADGAGEGKGAVFICCLGLAGGCGTSSVAIGVGREIAAYKEKRTLYLSLEPLESDRLCLGGAEEQAGKDMGGFLYALAKRGMGNGRGLAEGYLHKDSYGLERFLPSGGRNDLEALPLEEFKALARNVLAPGFEAIVFDLGHGAGAKARWLVESCDALALVGRGGGKEEKTAALVREGWGADGARVVMVRNMAEADAGEDEGGGPGEAKPRLPRPRPGFGRALPRLGLGPPPGADRSREREGEGADGEDAHCVEILFDRESFSVEGGMTDFTLANHFGGGVRRITEALLGEGGLW